MRFNFNRKISLSQFFLLKNVINRNFFYQHHLVYNQKNNLYFLKKKYISSIIKLEKEIENYIYYYNNERIKNKLRGLTPASYTKQFLLIS